MANVVHGRTIYDAQNASLSEATGDNHKDGIPCRALYYFSIQKNRQALFVIRITAEWREDITAIFQFPFLLWLQLFAAIGFQDGMDKGRIQPYN
jgi:hypothetical protein